MTPTTPPMLYRDDLERLSCANPLCTHTSHGPLFMHASCHPTAATYVLFQPGSDHLRVICATCEQPVVQIAVGERPGMGH